jgi:oxaloacetate decarboxylase alpha subunit
MKEDIIKKIIGDEEVITTRPADLIKPQLEAIKNEMKEYLEQEEDVLSHGLFPQVAEEFFKFRETTKYKIDSDYVNMEEKIHPA